MSGGALRPHLVAEELGCIRGGREIFAGLSFSVGSGGLLAILGKNGAGKSSLLRQIAGLVPIAKGRLRWQGDDRPLAEAVHLVGHLDGVKASLSVAENLGFWRELYADPWHSVEAALDRLGLLSLASFAAIYLSQGQKRRLALARLLVTRRPVWLLDEPAAGLDGTGQAILAALMGEHLKSGGLIVAATHGPLGVAATETLEMA